MSRLSSLTDAVPGYVVRFRSCPWVIASVGPVPNDLWTEAEEAAIAAWEAEIEEKRKDPKVWIGTPKVPYAPWRIKLDVVDGFPRSLYKLKPRQDSVTLRGLGVRLGVRLGRGSLRDESFWDWDLLDDWPRAAICSDCGLLWPCADEMLARALSHAEYEAKEPRCERCDRRLRGCMTATVGKDDPWNPDAPGAQMFCGRKGPCLTAAHRAAAARGLTLSQPAAGCSWSTDERETVL